MKKFYISFIVCFIGLQTLAQSPLNVLFVNDNGVNPDNTTVMLQLLEDAEVNFSVFDAVAEMRSPDLLELQNHNLVIWYLSSDGVGRYFWNGDDTDNNHLRLYLEQGGMLWVIGTDFMYDRYATPYSFGAGDFVYDYLGVGEYHAQAYADDGFLGVPQLDLAEGIDWLSLNPVQWVFATLWYVDAIATSPNAEAVYMMGPESYVFSDYAAAVKLSADSFRTMSFFFDFALIDSPANRQTLMNEVLNYFSNLVNTNELSTIDNEFSISPNPASDIINIHYKNDLFSNEMVQVYDLTGKLMFESAISTDMHQLSVSSLKNGIYFVKLGDKTRKLIISN